MIETGELDLHEEAKLMGYKDPRCTTCRFMLLLRDQPDRGLCSRQRYDRYHNLPVVAWELCERWEPRWGIKARAMDNFEAKADANLREALLQLDQECDRVMQEVFSETSPETGQAGEAFAGW
jgi:hypothetical protein